MTAAIDNEGDLPNEVDFIVVGSGGAGLAGALTAAARGATVLVLEKGELAGGTTAISGGGMWIPLNHHMTEVGEPDSREDALAYLRAISAPSADDALAVAYIDNAAPMAALLETEGGLSFRPYPTSGTTLDYRSEEPGARHGGRSLDSGYVPVESLRSWGLEKVRLGIPSFFGFDKFIYYIEKMHAWHPEKAAEAISQALADAKAKALEGEPEQVVANGGALIAQLLRGCLKLGAQIEVSAPVTQLVIRDGRVVGVECDFHGATRIVSARSGVLVASGGFTHDRELMQQYLPGRTVHYTCDVATNTGDGLRLGLAVGGALANMDDAWWMPAYTFGDEATPDAAGSMVREERCLPHTLMVNSAGVRFTNEAANYYDVGEVLEPGGSGSNIPAWLIWDSQAADVYSMFKMAPRPDDGSHPSWLIEAPTLADLAARCELDVDVLAASIDRFNEGARVGADPDFGRGTSKWDREWGDPLQTPNPSLGTVERGPFYAVQINTGIFSTKGGLKVDADARVLAEADGAAIPGLYAAGNASNCCAPGAYPGLGGTLGPGMTFGYLAALHATKTR